MDDKAKVPAGGDRLAKVIARAGLCSRRDAEGWIKDGRVAVNGTVIRTPAFNVTERDKIAVDGRAISDREGTRLWLYHKPAGLVVTEKDPEGRPTIFEKLSEEGLPRVLTVGRLDINTEGLLLLTNDGGLKRILELPSTGWLRKYRVRAHGTVTQEQLDKLKGGIEIEGVKYGPIDATLERPQGTNVWLLVGLREGKNREVKNVLGALGLEVNRLIRVSYGPFQLGDLPIGAVETVKAKMLREQLGQRLAREAGVDFDSPPADRRPVVRREEGERPVRPRQDRPGGRTAPIGRIRPPRRAEPDVPAGHQRKIHYDDGRPSETFVLKNYGKKPAGEGKSGGKDVGAPPRSDRGERAPRRSAEGAPRPARTFGDKPRRPFGDKTRDASERPKRPYGDKPRDAGDRPRRPYGDKPATAGDRPKRAFDRSAPGGDRPRRPYGDKPRPTEDRPKRPFGDRPRAAEDRPKRSFSDRSRPAGDKPRGPRTGGSRPPRGNGPRPSGPRGPKKPRG
jgi:23S rRNA pseudouridine2605 synthase